MAAEERHVQLTEPYKIKDGNETELHPLSAQPASPIRHIAWSARILAATRAEETERTTSPPLVVDPLAANLAYPNHSHSGSGSSSGDGNDEYGSRRMWLHHTHFHFRRIKDREDSAEVARLQAEAVELNRDKAERPDTLIRCRYIDQLLAAVEAPASAAPSQQQQQPDQPTHFQQLVLLGAGLDTRAYRCDCLAGVRVYEVDRAEVFTYKRAILQQSKADFKAASVEYIVGELTKAVDGGESVTGTAGAHSGGGGQKGKRREKAEEKLDLTKARDRRALQVIQQKRSKQQHAAQSAASHHADTSSLSPATAASTTAAVELSVAPAWSTALLASSTFDASLPTIWILEGLCMYLTPAQLSSLLCTAASLCPPSSILCFDHVTAKLGRWHRLFSSALSRADCVRLVESACAPNGGWRVGERRGQEVRAGYEVGDGVVGIGRDELSYGRYCRDVLVVEAGNGQRVVAQSYIVTAVRQPH